MDFLNSRMSYFKEYEFNAKVILFNAKTSSISTPDLEDAPSEVRTFSKAV